MLGVIGQQVYRLRSFFSRGLSGTRVVERDFRSKTFTLLWDVNQTCVEPIQLAKNLYSIFIVRRSHYDISMFWNSPQASRPSGRIPVARIFDSYRNNERDELRFLFHVFNKRWFLSIRKIIWQCFACKGQFNISGNFSTDRDQGQFNSFKKKVRGKWNLKIMYFFPLSLFPDIKNS